MSLGSVVNWLARTAEWLGGFYLLLAAVAALRESDLPLFLPEEKSRPERYGYGVAVAIVLAATAVRFALSPALGMSSPFLTFYPAVILAALYGGLRAGGLTTVLSALIADYFWMEPVGRFAIRSPTDWITMLLFLLASTMISFAIEAMHKARVGLVLHQDHLEELVKIRTGELEREVVERRRADEALQESESALRSFFDAPGDMRGIVEVVGGDDVRHIADNAVTAAFVGLTPEAMKNKLGSELGEPKEILRTWVTLYNESMQMGIGRPVTHEYQDARGDQVAWPTATVSYLGTPPHGDPRFAYVVRDITERKQAEEALRKSEARWNSAIEFLREGVIIATEAGEVIYWNPAAQVIHGFTRPGEGIGPLKETPNTFDLIIPNTDRVLPLEEWPMPRIMRGESVRDFELRLRRPDQGWERIVSYSGAMVETASGERLVFLSVYDLTERKRAEKALQRAHDDLEQRVIERTEQLANSEKEFRSLAEAMPQIVWITRADGWNIYFNQQWVNYTGLTLEESYGHGWNKPFHPDDQQRAWDAWQNAVTNNGTYSLECRLRAADGTYRWWLVRGVPVANEKGETTKWFGTCTDIEEFKSVEAQLRQAQKLEALGTLSGGIAHDFNNILAAIIGFGELLEGNVMKGSKDERHLKRILEASLRGRDLVRQLLTFSRKAEQEKMPVLLSGIVRETVQLVRATTPTTIDIRLGSVRESGLVLGDPTQIQQVLMNLCTNAVYAMQESGGILDIELSDFSASPSQKNPLNIEPGPYMKLAVRDTGIGMPPDVMDRIFDPFFTTKGLGAGTGLGLSVVLGIVKQSNGHITAESEPSRGSTFTVYFPKIAEELDIAESGDESIPTGDERILFVDDEEALVEMGEDVLAELGYDVTSRTSSKEALSLLKKDPSRFDLIITDQTMPGMTGVELAKEILAIRPDMPIIMCTGFSHLVDADKAKMAGIGAFAMKPLTKREIARTIRQVLDE